jgi:hypothetical protein
VKDLEFCGSIETYLTHLQSRGLIESWRLTRKKLGFGPSELGDFHLMIETRDLAQLDRAFAEVATRAGDVEGFHAAVNQAVSRVTFALYRDFPDPVRKSGEERF